MNTPSIFFLSLGIYNLLGSLLLFGFLSDAFGDTFLRRYCQIFSMPYSIKQPGSMWLIWAASLNLFFGAVNLLAARWEATAQWDLLVIDISLYALFVVLSIFALFSPHYSRGIWFNFPIFFFWIFWALYLMAAF